MSPSPRKKPDVMSGLPTTRPQRRSARRSRAETVVDVPPGTNGDTATPEANAEASPARATAKTARTTGAKGKTRAVGSAKAAVAGTKGKTRASGGAKAGATSTNSKSRASAKNRAGATSAKSKRGPSAGPTSVAARPKAGRERLPQPGQPRSLPPQPPDTAEPPAAGRPGGGEIIGTAIQAAGELAEIGLTLGTQALRNAISRLPRP